MKRPTADLDALAVPKDAIDTRPPAPLGEALPSRGYAHTLSLRLTSNQYRRLRRYVADQEDRTGKRATHQAIIETALDEYLTSRSA
jgi:hypothetical protein